MDRSVFEILDAIGVNLLRLLIHDYLPQRFHAKQFYDLLINHHPLEYREMRNRYAHKPEQEIDGIVNAQISQYLLKRSSELNISKIQAITIIHLKFHIGNTDKVHVINIKQIL